MSVKEELKRDSRELERRIGREVEGREKKAIDIAIKLIIYSWSTTD